jgi:hypothetical protein
MFRKIWAAMAAMLLAAGVTLAALNPTFVWAAPGGDAIVEEATVITNHHLSVAAEIAVCPAGRRALGGGFFTSQQGVVSLLLSGSSPVDEAGLSPGLNDGGIARGWYAVLHSTEAFPLGQEFGDSQRTRYKVVALCSATSDATVATATFTARPKLRGAAVATCPFGTRAVGGGVRSLGESAFTLLLTSGPVNETGTFELTETGDVARGWHASVLNFANFEQTYKVFALCSRTSDATVVVNASNKGSATCPLGRRVVGGGIGIAFGDDSQSRVDASGPQAVSAQGTTDGAVANHWFAQANPDKLPFKILALCATNEP